MEVEKSLEAFHDEQWFVGAFWWDWSTELYDTREEAMKDKGFDIHGKQAELNLKKWYLKD